MVMEQNNNPVAVLDRYTKRSVRSFWMDGLWDLVISGMLVIIAVWGAIYVQIAAFPSWTWPFFQNAGRSMVWIGLLILVAGLALYIWGMWMVVKLVKKRMVAPYTGFAEHRFIMRVDHKVYGWYLILYICGLGILYGLFAWISGGVHMMSVPFIISPAAILVGVGWYYQIRRYLWLAAVGLVLAFLLEIFATTQANYLAGPQNYLNILPQWGSPVLPCLVWAALFLVSGVLGLAGTWRRAHEPRSAA